MKGRLERYAVGRTISEIERVAIDSLRMRLDQDIILEISAYRPYRGADAQVRVEFFQEGNTNGVPLPQEMTVSEVVRERARLEADINRLIEGFENRTQLKVRQVESFARKEAENEEPITAVRVRLDL